MRQFITFRIRRILITIGLFFLCNGAFTQTVKRITAAECHSFIEDQDMDKLKIIDGRDSSMFVSGHLKHAVNINAFSEEADEKLSNYLEREKLLPGLKPIVQVFGTAAYDVENEYYAYGFGRAHLGFQYQFNEDWNAKMIIDRGRPTTIDNLAVSDSAGNMLNVDNATKEGSYYTMWLKFASLKWQVNDILSLVGGALLQNHYITQERFWGFRYVAQTFQDLYWHIPSTDLGFRANYKLNDVFSLDAALTNGEGPRVKQDAFGNVKYAGGLDINPGDNFQSRIFYHNQTNGVDSLSTEQMFSVFAGYKFNDKFRVAGEFNYMENLNNATGTDSYGFSVYSAYQIVDNTQLFIRYDRLLNENNNTNISIMNNGNTLIGGVSWSPVKGVNMSLNYQGWIPDAENNKAENNVLLSMEYKF